MVKRFKLDEPMEVVSPATELLLDEVNIYPDGIDVWLRMNNGRRRQVAIRRAAALALWESDEFQNMVWSWIDGHADLEDLQGVVEDVSRNISSGSNR